MDERRQFVRLGSYLDVTYTVQPSTDAQFTVTKDVSAGGVCFLGEDVFDPGTRLNVTMKLPDRPQPVQFTAEVVWSEPYEVVGKTGRRRSVETGARFVDISGQDREAIQQHVIVHLQPPTERT